MPKITFNEVDLTSPGTLNVTANTVYVPGFSVSGPVNEPTLLNSVADLESKFGTGTITFSSTFIYNNKKVFAQGQKEPSYLYAKTLLAAGLPVMFERVSDAASTIAPENAYDKLSKALSAAKVKDCGSYNVKFLTTGGYPNVDGIAKVAENSKTSLFDNGDSVTGISDHIIRLVADSFKAADLTVDQTIANRLYNHNLGYAEVHYGEFADIVSPYGLNLNNTFDINTAESISFAICSNAKYLRKLGESTNAVHSWILNNCWLEVVANKEAATDCDNLWTVKLYGYKYSDGTVYAPVVDASVQTAGGDGLTYEGTDTAGTDAPKEESKRVLLTTHVTHAETLKDLVKDFYFCCDVDSGITKMTIYATTAVSTTSSEANSTFSVKGLGDALYTIAANNRKDCVALLDHTPDIKPENVVEELFPNLDGYGEYGAMFTPWGTYSIAGETLVYNMPASLGYLLALARSTANNPDWLAIAGANRGGVPNLQSVNEKVTNAVAESYQSRMGISINPITEITPYGDLIWGNRTLKNNPANLTAKSFLNIRVLICNVVKTAFAAARSMTFEQNNDILWVNFKSMIIPTLDQMVKGAGISAYELKKRANKQKAELRCVIRLYAIEAVEDFEIELQLADDTSAVIE